MISRTTQQLRNLQTQIQWKYGINSGHKKEQLEKVDNQ